MRAPPSKVTQHLSCAIRQGRAAGLQRPASMTVETCQAPAACHHFQLGRLILEMMGVLSMLAFFWSCKGASDLHKKNVGRRRALRAAGPAQRPGAAHPAAQRAARGFPGASGRTGRRGGARAAGHRAGGRCRAHCHRTVAPPRFPVRSAGCSPPQCPLALTPYTLSRALSKHVLHNSLCLAPQASERCPNRSLLKSFRGTV